MQCVLFVSEHSPHLLPNHDLKPTLLTIVHKILYRVTIMKLCMLKVERKDLSNKQIRMICEMYEVDYDCLGIEQPPECGYHDTD